MDGIKFNYINSINEIGTHDFRDLFNGNLTGIVIKNILPDTPKNKIIESFKKIKSDSKYQFANNSGESYPKSFPFFVENYEFDDFNYTKFLEGNEFDFQKLNQEETSFVINDLKEVINKLTPNYIGDVPNISTPKNKIKAIPFTVRNLFTNSSGLKYHVGNSFKSFYKPFFEFFSIPNQAFQMSFFYVLKKPIIGGELKVYEAKYPEFKECGDRVLLMNNSKEIKLDLISSKVIDLNEGDFVLFNGGQYWHEVTPIVGKENRITLGGFISFFENKAWYWA